MNSRFYTAIFFAFISPIFLVISAFKSFSWSYKRWALTLFITIYGSTIQLMESNDGFRHRAKVYDHYLDLSFQDWLYELINILTFKINASGVQDVYKHVLSYFVASIGMPGFFFTLVAFVYGYFFSGAMLLILRNFWHVNKSYLFWGFVILFLLIKNIEGVNTVRTWTGLWVLVYACLRYYEQRKLKYLILMFVPPFIHMGYFIMAIPTYLVLVFGNRKLVYAILFVLSSFINFINPTDVTPQVEQTELGAKKLRGYYVEEQTDTQTKLQYENQRNATWYRKFQKAGIQKYAMNIFIYSLLFSGIYFKYMTPYQRTIFSIGLLTLTLSNTTWFLFAVSNRSYIVGMIFIFAAFIMSYLNQSTSKNNFSNNIITNAGLLISFVLFIPYLIYNLSDIFQYPSVFLLFAPYLVWIDESINISMKEFVKLFI